MNSLRALLRLLRPYRLSVLMNIGFNLLASVFSVFSLLMLIPFLQVLFYDSELSSGTMNEIGNLPFFENLYRIWLEQVKQNGKIEGLYWLCLALILIFLLKNFLRYLALYVLTPVRTGIMRDLRIQMFEKLLSLDLPFLQRTRRGDILTRLGQDVQEVEYGIIHFIETGFKEPVTILVTLFSLLWMSPQLTLWVFILLPVAALIIGRIGKQLKKESIEAQQKMSLLQSLTDELLHGLKILQIYQAEKPFSAIYEKENNTYRGFHTKLLWRKELASPLSEFLGIGVVAILLWVGGRQVLLHPGDLRPEVFITYIVVFSQIISPAKAFANAWYYIQKGSASLLRIESLLAEKPTILDAPEAASLEYSGQDIRIQNLNFSYKDTPVLKNIDLLIQQGKKIAIAGPSGSGKTTLVHLLCRFYPIPEQSIFMGETPIEKFSLESLRKQFAFVTQEPLLFYGSVKENLWMAKPDATELEVLNALKLAQAEEFVAALPQGMDTNIGERGTQLSGGQQQRISLARAFLKNAPIIILDEATAALDNNADHAIQSAILQLQQGKTVIAIAHRLSSVRDYDSIIVMEKGVIIATGTHKELMEECELYREMVKREGM